MAKVSTSVSLDKDNKTKGQDLFESLGLDMSTAFNIFLAKCVREKGFPFPITTENSARAAADDFTFTLFPNKPHTISATRELNRYCNLKGINPASLSSMDILTLMDTFFGVLSELYVSDCAYAHALIMECLPEGDEYPSVSLDGDNFYNADMDPIPDKYTPFGDCFYVFDLNNGTAECEDITGKETDKYSISVYANTIFAIIEQFIGRNVTGEEIMKMMEFATENLYAVACERAIKGEMNGRPTGNADVLYYERCILEEIAILYPQYVKHRETGASIPMYNKGEWYCNPAEFIK